MAVTVAAAVTAGSGDAGWRSQHTINTGPRPKDRQSNATDKTESGGPEASRPVKVTDRADVGNRELVPRQSTTCDGTD